ncbi:MAG TPA: SIR2 family protein [Herpetosiphonaceae bacterium]
MALPRKAKGSKKIDEGLINIIAEYVKRGECILFLGAGAHYPPPKDSSYTYPEHQRPPLGSALCEHLSVRSGLSEQPPKERKKISGLQRVSLYYETKRSRKALVDEIRQMVGEGKTPSPVIRALARLNFPLVFTTNYDRLFEMALHDEKKAFNRRVYSKDRDTPTEDYLEDPNPQQPIICKIHGDIGNPDSIVITDEDYIQFVLRMGDPDIYHPVPETFRFYFKRWPTLFIGYSLMDYNLRLLFKTMRWKIDRAKVPDMYSVDLSPDPLILDVWELQQKYVKFITQDVWSFVPMLYQKVTGEEFPPR